MKATSGLYIDWDWVDKLWRVSKISFTGSKRYIPQDRFKVAVEKKKKKNFLLLSVLYTIAFVFLHDLKRQAPPFCTRVHLSIQVFFFFDTGTEHLQCARLCSRNSGDCSEGRSVFEHLPSAQDVISGSKDWVPHWAPLSLCLSWINTWNIFKINT